MAAIGAMGKATGEIGTLISSSGMLKVVIMVKAAMHTKVMALMDRVVALMDGVTATAKAKADTVMAIVMAGVPGTTTRIQLHCLKEMALMGRTKDSRWPWALTPFMLCAASGSCEEALDR